MKHQLVILTGSSPGVGKSTIATFLAQQLTQQRIACDCVLEDDDRLNPAMQKLAHDLREDAPDRAKSLLFAASYVIEHIAKPPTERLIDKLSFCAKLEGDE